jgi:hypothetical protein
MLSSWSLSYCAADAIEAKPRRLQGVGNRQFHISSAQRAEKGPEAGALESCHLGSAVAQVCAISPHSLAPGQRTRENNAVRAQTWEGVVSGMGLKSRDTNRGREKDAEGRVDEFSNA